MGRWLTNCYIPSESGRTRDHHHVRTSWYSTLDSYLVWHSDPPSPLKGLRIGSQVMDQFMYDTRFPHPPTHRPTNLPLVVVGSLPVRWCESNDPGVTSALFALRLPRFLIKLCAWFSRHILRDEVYASPVEGLEREKTSRRSMPSLGSAKTIVQSGSSTGKKRNFSC
jgi:hypothetical protein